MHLLAIFLGWHSAHRYLIAQGQGASLSPLEYLRDQTPIRFVLNQLLNMLLMLALALLLLIPVTLYFAQDAALMSEQDAARLQAMISVTALPIMFVVFARLLLVAPVAARGQKRQLCARFWPPRGISSA